MADILDGLNEPQREAATTIDGPVMVIAGAGSGKTRALTYRIAYMIEQGIEPFSIMALTFTNKAAIEMKERVMKLVNPDEARNVWMGTFHSIFARILRIEAERIGYTSNYTIYDTDDSKQLITNIVKDMNLDPKAYPAKNILNRISMAKSSMYTPDDYCNDPEIQEADSRAKKPLTGEIFRQYNERLQRSNAMDFDDILFYTNMLLRDNPDVLYKYQHRFRYILVDEYQDTNYAQYLIVKRLAALHENLCVVGDDAQSIYGFRGANIQNILNFKVDYPDNKLIRLEQNYRSTQNIVNAANSVIAYNKDQIKKTVWSDKECGERITLLRASSDSEEGTLVANSIFGYRMQRRLKNKDFAVLYRTNAQSRSIEEALRRQNIPYRIYGGLSFYDRKEVKDFLAYFRLVINPNDESALLRIINYPARGIGKTTTEKLMIAADKHKCSIWELITTPQLLNSEVGPAIANKVEAFATMIQSFMTLLGKMTAFELAKHINTHIGLVKLLKEDDSPEGVSRVENIEELMNAIMEFSDKQVDETTGEQAHVGLVDFMQEVSLLSDLDTKDSPDDDHVCLMTIHMAKGLEFPYVYVVGMEENLFPSLQTLSTRAELEEERRLFYVAITRAMEKLTLSYAESRYRWGNFSMCEPSRFLNEIDKSLIETTQKASFRGTTSVHEDRPQFGNPWKKQQQPPQQRKLSTMSQAQNATPQDFAASDPDELSVGMRVAHLKFGEGTVVRLEGAGPNRKATVNFDSEGTKQLMLKFAKLRIL